MRVQETHRVLKSQQNRMSVVYMCYLNITCPPGHHHNRFMVTGALEPIMVRLVYILKSHYKEIEKTILQKRMIVKKYGKI